MELAKDDRLASALAENAALRRRLAKLESASGNDAATRLDPAPDEIAGLKEEIAGLKKALHKSESRYRLIVESAVDYAIIAADLDGTVTTWNEAAEAVLGWSERQIVGRPIATIFTPEDVEAGVPEREMSLSLTMGKASDERWHLKADGSRFFASGEMMPLLGDDEKPAGVLKILRDRTRERKERQELEVSRERLHLALEVSDLVGTWDWDIPGDSVYVNTRFAHLFGVDPALADKGVPIETFLRGVHPDDLAGTSAAINAAIETGSAYSQEYRSIDSDGTIHWVFAKGRCFYDSNGNPLRFPGAIVDRTADRARGVRQSALLRLGDELILSETSASHTDKALEILGETLDIARVGYAHVDAAATTATIASEWTAENATALSGVIPLEQFGTRFLDELQSGLVVIENTADHSSSPAVKKAWSEIGIGALLNLTVVEDGRVRVILYLHAAKPRRWSDEEVTFIREVLNRSWTFSQRRHAEQALIETERRLRLAQESAGIGTFDYDLRSGELRWDERCKAMFGLGPDAEVSYAGSFLPALHPDDRERVEAAVDLTLDPSSGGTYDIVHRIVGLTDGLLRHIHAAGQTIADNGETVRFIGAVRDVTEQMEAEERQKMLTRELQHRVKNTLAMVNALANQTLRRATNVQDGLAAFSARLIALGKAHDILTQTSWTSAPIAAIVANSLETHQPRDESRIAVSGPDLRLTARQSLALALGLHELATNATKYGALSNDTGQVRIEWDLESAKGTRQLTFTWHETGGPPVEAPAARGFGSRLIEQAMAAEFGGEVKIDYRPEGIVCTIEAAVTEEPAEEDPA